MTILICMAALLTSHASPVSARAAEMEKKTEVSARQSVRTWKNSPIAFAGIGLIMSSGRKIPYEDLDVDGNCVDNPAWSPDRKKLSGSVGFHGNNAEDLLSGAGPIQPRREAEEGLYVFNANGHGKWRATWGKDEYPTWSPDASKIVFERFLSDKPERKSKLAVVELKTHKVTGLTDGRFDDRQPDWSPNGRLIAFCSNRTGQYKIWTLDLTTKQLALLPGQPAGHCTRPQWSPDGNTVLFVSTGSTIYNYPATACFLSLRDTTCRRVQFPRMLADRIVWSPDGKRVAYMASVQERSWAVCIAAPDGTKVFQVLPQHGGMKTGWNVTW